MSNIREFLGWNHGYYEINREERNFAAVLYHLLLKNDNLKTFLALMSSRLPIVDDEVAIYFEYSFLRDLWANIAMNQTGNHTKRNLIYTFLNPVNINDLQTMTIQEFNMWFGAPNPSRRFIQSPSNWSIGKFASNINDNSEFYKVCCFKWAFNAKPDIVIHTSLNSAICIECKYESVEGSYPTKAAEIKEFENRGLNRVQQTELQRYIMTDLLGIQTEFLFIDKAAKQNNDRPKQLLWKDIFPNLDFNGSLPFVQKWIDQIINC